MFQSPVLRPGFQCCSLSADPVLGEALDVLASADLQERLWEPNKGSPFEGVSKGFLEEVSLEMSLKSVTRGLGVLGEERREECSGNQE